MKENEEIKILESREFKVVKHNIIVQKSRFVLSLSEQKMMNFLISLIKPVEEYPNRKQPLEYEFDIKDYCNIFEIDYKSGKNYKMIRDTLKSLRDKSIVIMLEDGTETIVSLLNKVWCNKGRGRAKVRFDEDMAPYLLALREQTTRFRLGNIKAMESKYSPRLYELCKSFEGIHSKKYSLEELRSLLGIPTNELVRYPDFRRKVLEVAEKEINAYTDIHMCFEPYTRGRKTVAIRLYIRKKQ